MKKKFLSALWYVFFTLLLLEIFARIAYAVPYTAGRLMALDDCFWQRRWIDAQKNKTSDFFYTDNYSPTTGWIAKPNIKNKVLWENTFLNTNTKGLRGTKDYSYEKNPAKKRILVIGDSFTFGDEVNDNETYSYYLQERFPNAEVINMGMHGYGHDQILILLKEEGIKYQPDIVILGFLTEDMSRNILQFRDYAKPKYIIENDQLVLTNSPVPTVDETRSRDWLRPRIKDLWFYIRFNARKKNGKQQLEMEKITRFILKEIATTAQSIGAEPIFVYLPYGQETMSLEENISGERYLMETCQTNKTTHCFTSRSHFIPKVKAGKTFRTEFHWFAPSHQTIAESISEYLLAEELVEDVSDIKKEE